MKLCLDRTRIQKGLAQVVSLELKRESWFVCWECFSSFDFIFRTCDGFAAPNQGRVDISSLSQWEYKTKTVYSCRVRAATTWVCISVMSF